jgi:DNA-directed RNA polymerase sigma subunit (sigma70/sigma32)
MRNPKQITINNKNYTALELGELLEVTTERIRQLKNLGLLEERVKGASPLKPWDYRKRYDKK